MLARIANREDPDQTASSALGLPCLSRPFWQATSVRNFRTFTVLHVKSGLTSVKSLIHVCWHKCILEQIQHTVKTCV